MRARCGISVDTVCIWSMGNLFLCSLEGLPLEGGGLPGQGSAWGGDVFAWREGLHEGKGFYM